MVKLQRINAGKKNLKRCNTLMQKRRNAISTKNAGKKKSETLQRINAISTRNTGKKTINAATQKHINTVSLIITISQH